jgi:hypothetical protein
VAALTPFDNLKSTVTYFADDSPYAYGHGSHTGVVHMGWLDSVHPYPRGVVEVRLIEKMKLLASKLVELYRGFHICELRAEPSDLVKTNLPTGWSSIRTVRGYDGICNAQGNGEIRVPYEGIIFAAPVLIVHSIEAHNYLPSTKFLKAVEETLISSKCRKEVST